MNPQNFSPENKELVIKILERLVEIKEQKEFLNKLERGQKLI